jgi:hypothetical protein
MSPDDPLQQNIRRTTAQQTLKKIRAIVDEENAKDAFKGRALRWLFHYGWLVLLMIAALMARFLGVI